MPSQSSPAAEVQSQVEQQRRLAGAAVAVEHHVAVLSDQDVLLVPDQRRLRPARPRSENTVTSSNTQFEGSRVGGVGPRPVPRPYYVGTRGRDRGFPLLQRGGRSSRPDRVPRRDAKSNRSRGRPAIASSNGAALGSRRAPIFRGRGPTSEQPVDPFWVASAPEREPVAECEVGFGLRRVAVLPSGPGRGRRSRGRCWAANALSSRSRSSRSTGEGSRGLDVRGLGRRQVLREHFLELGLPFLDRRRRAGDVLAGDDEVPAGS